MRYTHKCNVTHSENTSLLFASELARSMASDKSNIKIMAQGAYDALRALFEAHQGHVLEIEILPSAMSPEEGQFYVQDGLSVGIPKKVLVSAFLAAREVFAGRNNEHTRAGLVRTRTELCTLMERPDESKDILSATNVILLFDPEYLTAANYRKTHHLSQPPEHSSDAHTKELNFLNSVLLSPLHRQSKSPTLWHHRCWLISRSFEPPDLNSLVEDVGWAERGFQGIFEGELNAVLKAGERHANNYYAWGYGRSLVRLMDSLEAKTGGKVIWSRRDEATQRTLGWCKRHPSDTSGWSFLLFLLQQGKCGEKLADSVLTEVLEFVVAVKWEKEALWHFLRTATVACRFPHDRDREKQVEDVKRVVRVLDSARGVTRQAEHTADGETKSPWQRVLEWFPLDPVAHDGVVQELGVKGN